MPPRSKKPLGKRDARVTILCEWCAVRRECTRRDVRTCGDRCRARMKHYVDYLGYRPDAAPGPITAQMAVNLELHRLITDEQRRRAAVAAERAAYLARPEGQNHHHVS